VHSESTSFAADEVLTRVAEMCAAGHFEESARVLADALRRDGSAHALRYQLSQVKAELGHLSEAEQLARDAASVGGDAYARGLGFILGKLGKLQEAEAWLRRALDRDPHDAWAYATLGAVYGDQRRLSDALTCLERALSIAPDFSWAKSTRKGIQQQQAFLTLVRETYRRFERQAGLDPDLETLRHFDVEFPSAALAPDGTPRFVMSIPSSLIISDLGAALLFYHEVAGQGYECVMRHFLDVQLRSDDVFIDVGAHWGVHSLSAATRLPKQVGVLAIEANPENSARLASWVKRNKLESEIEVIPNAVGDRVGIAHMRINGSSMGHRVTADGVHIDMTTLDQVLADRDWLRWRRILLKVDVEGHEPEVFAGARQLFSKCRVAAVIWEKSEFHEAAVQKRRTSMVFDFLNAHGFRHYRFEDESDANSLAPLMSNEGPCNVFSLATATDLR
jgi:FkbM family methyltransferase